MKNLKIFFVAATLMLLAGQQVQAQYYDKGMFTLGYNMGITTGSTTDFIDQGSFRNFSVEGAGFVKGGFAIGGRISYDNFYQDYGRSTWSNGTGSDITANKYNYLNSMNLQATFSYYFNRGGIIQPYVGMGIGTAYLEKRTEYGMLYDGDATSNSWNFSLTPEAGVYIPFGVESDWGATVRVQYNHIFFNDIDVSGVNYLNFGVGITHRF